MLIQGLSTLGGLVLSIQCTTISMEAFPLYKSIGPIVANFFQEHITHQFGTLTKLQATNGALAIKVLLYQAMAIPCTLFKATVVPRTTLLESWWSYASHCWNLCNVIIKVAVILHLGASSFTIYLRGLHIDLHEDQSLHQLNQGYCSSYGTFCYIKSLHVQQQLFYYSSISIRSNNMINTYDSINAITIKQPILQVAIQSLCFLKQLFQQGLNLNGKLILSSPSPSNFFKN